MHVYRIQDDRYLIYTLINEDHTEAHVLDGYRDFNPTVPIENECDMFSDCRGLKYAKKYEDVVFKNIDNTSSKIKKLSSIPGPNEDIDFKVDKRIYKYINGNIFETYTTSIYCEKNHLG